MGRKNHRRAGLALSAAGAAQGAGGRAASPPTSGKRVIRDETDRVNTGRSPIWGARVLDAAARADENRDLVIIDPAGTGRWRALCTHNRRRRSRSKGGFPGVSYGATGATAVVYYIQARRSLTFNGLICLSVVTDIEAISVENLRYDRPDARYLPGCAAIAWYDRVLPAQPLARMLPLACGGACHAAGPTPGLSTHEVSGCLSDAGRDVVALKLRAYTARHAAPQGGQPACVRSRRCVGAAAFPGSGCEPDRCVIRCKRTWSTDCRHRADAARRRSWISCTLN